MPCTKTLVIDGARLSTSLPKRLAAKRTTDLRAENRAIPLHITSSFNEFTDNLESAAAERNTHSRHGDVTDKAEFGVDFTSSSTDFRFLV